MMNAEKTTELKVGQHIKPDGWAIGETLLPGDEPVGSWQGCQFRLPSWAAHTALAVNVKVTGRNPALRGQFAGMYRCKITFVGDGKPDTTTGGWVLLK